MRRFHAALLLTVVWPSATHAQAAARADEAGRLAVASDSLPMSIAEAEKRAQRPINRLAIDSMPRQDIAIPSVGTTERRCVDVGQADRVYSGDFVMGIGPYQEIWSSGYGKIAWFPIHASRSSPKNLLVTATRLDAKADGRIYEAEFTRGQYYMYPSGIHVPSVGRWMLVATAGDTWGCLVLTVH